MGTEKIFLDTSGYPCPIPLAMISRKLKGLNVGDTLEIVSDDLDFKKQIKIWSYETGNQLVDIKREGEKYLCWMRKGSGFKGETLLENVKFIAVGIKLHFIKALLQIIPLKKIRYLITFVSVAEGLRAEGWVAASGKEKKYTLLPVPKGITQHCGLVFGFCKKNEAVEIFELLKQSHFGVEDIYYESREKAYQILQIESS